MSRRMRTTAVALSLLAGIALVTHSYHPIPHIPEIPKFQIVKPKTAPHSIPRKIWQTWRDPPQGLSDDYRDWSKTWSQKNPDYRYELLTDGTAMTFVQTTFHNRPDIIDTYIRTEDVILRADYTRYLALLAEGGTYVDMDTDCTRPIDSWIPLEYVNRTSFVVGVEYDAMDDGIRSDFEDRVQLCQWAFMSKPGNKVLEHIVNRVTKALQNLAPDGGKIECGSNDDVLHITGPRIFSHAILEALTEQMKRNITEDTLTKLTGPMLIGDVLILPVSAFGSGQAHSNSKGENNEEQLLWHHFNGFWGWKDAHDGKINREKEAKEKAEKEKAEQEEKEKSKAADPAQPLEANHGD
ncbi:hypothetical protein AMS68_002211 [Peltaster fructicola]|uniref:Initiation-specific alpha-1,6-mannosyltransferase n=1 Tax=Peltaster fructicola TaxID=286661 RepID=A0A6H0XPN8_9PEZI|nr:hypothetical protein AMS68_002211 [Peltaster fructicola]